MSQQGWISIHRQLRECWIWEDKTFDRTHAWIDLLLSANYQDNKIMFDGNLYDVERGSFITSIRKLCERWGWSNSKVKKFLDTLKDDGMITYKSDTKKTTINIVNYTLYQDMNITKNDTETSQKHHSNITEASQKHTNNNNNNSNNGNKGIYIKANQEIYELYQNLNNVFPSGADIVNMNDLIKIHGHDAVAKVLKKAYKKPWNYIETVLQNQEKEGSDSNGQHSFNNQSNKNDSKGKWTGFRPKPVELTAEDFKFDDPDIV